MDFHAELNRLGPIMNRNAGKSAIWRRGNLERVFAISLAEVTSSDIGTGLPAGVEIADLYFEVEDLGADFPPKLGDRFQIESQVYKVIGRAGNSSAFEYVTSDRKRVVCSVVLEAE